MVGRIDSSEQQLGRAVMRSGGADLTTGGGHAGSDGDVAHPGIPTGVHNVRTQNPAAAPTVRAHGAVKLLAPKSVDAPALSPARVPITTASTANSGVTGVGSEQGRPPSRTSSRSSLVTVKEGLYAIKPSIYCPVGEPHPMNSGIPGTSNNPTIAAQHGAASNAGDQRAHVEFGNGSASATSVEGQRLLENLHIATDDVPNGDSRALERMASSGSTFIHVSQL